MEVQSLWYAMVAQKKFITTSIYVAVQILQLYTHMFDVIHFCGGLPF